MESWKVDIIIFFYNSNRSNMIRFIAPGCLNESHRSRVYSQLTAFPSQY